MSQGGYYIAVIVSQASSTAEDHRGLYEETFVLLKASSLEEATERASARAREEGHEYRNAAGDTVTWSPQLVEVGETLVDSFEDGSEIYARFFRNRAAYEQLDFESWAKDDAEPQDPDE